MAYTFKDPISMIPDDLGLVRTAKMVRDTREFNRYDTDNIYAMLNTATVAPGDEWIINQLHEEVDGNLGSVVTSGNYFGATKAVAQSVSALKNSKGLKLASQSYAQYQKGKEMEDKLNAQYGSSLNFSDKKWQTHSSYYQDEETGKWVDNVFDYDVQRELDYNGEMIKLIGNIHADGGGISFKKHKVSPGDIRDFMYNSKGISKKKAKRVALALADAYLNGATGGQDYRKLTELDINENTGVNFTDEEALGDISQRLIDIASRQIYWDASVTQLAARKPPSNGNNAANQGSWTPVQGSAINGGLGWDNIENLHSKKVNAITQLFSNTGNGDADLNARTSANNVLQTLRNQESLIVSQYATDDVQSMYNNMNNAFTGNENLKDLLHFLTLNTTEFLEVAVPYDRIDSYVPSSKTTDNDVTWTTSDIGYAAVRTWAHTQGEEQNRLVKMVLGQSHDDYLVGRVRGTDSETDIQSQEYALLRLNATLGTDYTLDDRPILEDLVNNYFKYQITYGDHVDELMANRGTEVATQLSGFSVNTLTDENGTLGDINKMLTQSTLNQFTIDGVISGSPEYKAIMKEIHNTNKEGQNKDGQNFKFKQITQPGISTGTPARFMLTLSDGQNYTMTENYGIEREFGGGFTYSVLNSMTDQNPLIMMQESTAKDVQRKLSTGEYQTTGDGSIRSVDYLTAITPILKVNIKNLFLEKVEEEQGYVPRFSEYDAEEIAAYQQYENTQLQNYKEKVLSRLVWAAHMQLVESNNANVPQEYLGIDSPEELYRILDVDYNYSVLLQEYGLELPSSLITNVR